MGDFIFRRFTFQYIENHVEAHQTDVLLGFRWFFHEDFNKNVTGRYLSQAYIIFIVRSWVTTTELQPSSYQAF